MIGVHEHPIDPREMIPMFTIALIVVSIAGAWALVHAYRHEAAYERRVRRNA